LPTFGVKISYDMVRLNSYFLGIAGSYAIKMPAKTAYYDIKMGQAIGANLYLKPLTNETHKFQTELGMNYRKQDTSISEQEELKIILGVRFSF
jgi:uncharacterized UPF0146 family protein